MAHDDLDHRAGPLGREPFYVDTAAVAELCGLLGLDAHANARVRMSIEDLGTTYHRWIRQEQAASSLPAQRRQLTAIAKQAQHLLAKLAALDAAPEAEF